MSLYALRAGLSYTSGRFLILISDRGWVDPQGHSAAGNIRSIEKNKSSYLTGNLTRDLPACRIVPQLTTPPRASQMGNLTEEKYRIYLDFPEV
jgi:hypothetical protein